MLAPAPPQVLEALSRVPGRARAALFTLGLLLGLPGSLGVGAVLAATFEEPGVALLLGVLAFVTLLAGVALGWALLFGARRRLEEAERALYAGDAALAVRHAGFVVRTTFRSDMQAGALFVLALAAERVRAFARAAELFERAFAMVPLMAAPGSERRIRALMTAHAALDFAAAGDVPRASECLARCYRWLAAPAQGTGLGALFDDSSLGALSLNSVLRELENRRDPRPLAVLAAMLVAFRAGDPRQVLALLAQEGPAFAQGLAPHERALAYCLHAESSRLLAGSSPHRAPAPEAPPAGFDFDWASSIVAPPRS